MSNNHMDMRRFHLQNVARRMSILADSVEEDTENAAALFDAMYERLFHEPSYPQQHVFSERSLTPENVVDYMLTIVCNSTHLDKHVYASMYWSSFLLMCVSDSIGKRLMQSMEKRGFLFTDDAEFAADKLRTHKRQPDLWEKLSAHVDQLCAALTQDKQRTIAGLYNHIVKTCKLPKARVLKATKHDLKMMIKEYAKDPHHCLVLDKYVTRRVGGFKARMVTVNNDTDSVSVFLGAPQDVGRDDAPVFRSKKDCITFLINCA
ncbi:hypothetical protein OAM67_00945, partial [bacterium]|nr:hypothetical protein [bacterium]